MCISMVCGFAALRAAKPHTSRHATVYCICITFCALREQKVIHENLAKAKKLPTAYVLSFERLDLRRDRFGALGIASARVDLGGMLVILKRAGRILQLQPCIAARAIGSAVVGIEIQHQRVILDRALRVAQSIARLAALKVCFGVFGIARERLII